ncbi:hypothetical protein TYRP_004205 [Tyrophagus putrescentiae]|nr:hypothetical protein TYRP_004205 [Tyrophagus putrescentiae]
MGVSEVPLLCRRVMKVFRSERRATIVSTGIAFVSYSLRTKGTVHGEHVQLIIIFIIIDDDVPHVNVLLLFIIND